MERPLVRAGQNVERADVSRSRARRIVRAARQRKNDGVLVNASGIAAGPADGAVRVCGGIDDAVVAEGGDCCAGDRIDLRQIAAGNIHQAFIFAILAFPVVQTLRRCALMRPEFLAGSGVESNDRTGLGDIHRSIDDDRSESQRPASDGIAPRHLQLPDVRFVDLLQRGILRGVRPACVGLPGIEGTFVGAKHHHRSDQNPKNRLTHRLCPPSHFAAEYIPAAGNWGHRQPELLH